MPAIKTNNFSLTKESQQGTFGNGNVVGWAPGYEGKSEGVQTLAGRIRYGKGYSLMLGTCKNCDHNNGTDQAGGRHCDLPENKECIF